MSQRLWAYDAQIRTQNWTRSETISTEAKGMPYQARAFTSIGLCRITVSRARLLRSDRTLHRRALSG